MENNRLNSTESTSSSTFFSSKNNSLDDPSSSSYFGLGPLLGSAELTKLLPDNKQALIQITTFNMGSLPLPSDSQVRTIFNRHPLDQQQQEMDIHIIGIQESWPSPEETELLFQMSLGPGYVLFHSVTFGTLHLIVFIRRDLVWYTTEPLDITQTIRSGRLFKTKGAAGISFGLFGSRILVITAHLTAGEESSRVSQRMEELNKILQPHYHERKTNYDAIYVFGDLNFRVAGIGREKIVEMLKVNDFQGVLAGDQLRKVLISNDDGRNPSSSSSLLPESLRGFREAKDINFRPTYKYDIGTDNFDSSAKKRAPAYTDRIMYKCMKNDIICLKYESVPDIKISDHRPVIAVFRQRIKPGFDTLPLTGGKFKREIYAKAMQKRAKFLLDHRKQLASTACALQ